MNTNSDSISLAPEKEDDESPSTTNSGLEKDCSEGIENAAVESESPPSFSVVNEQKNPPKGGVKSISSAIVAASSSGVATSAPSTVCHSRHAPRHTETALCLPGYVLFIRPASIKR